MALSQKNTYKQRGFVSIEFMIVLAVVAVLIIVGLYYGNKIVDDNRGKSEATNIGFIVQKVRELYAQDSTYDGLSNEILIKTGDLPSSMVKGTNGLVNSWKNPITVTTQDSNRTFQIVTEGISIAQCQKIVNGFRTQAVAASVGSTKIYEEGVEQTGIVAKITSACSGSPKNITFKFK